MKALVITGSMGSGKTTMMGEISDLLAMRGVAHAAIDIDAFGNAHDPAGAIDLAAIAYRNVVAVVRNYALEDVTTFVMAGAIETGAELSRLREAVGDDAEIVVCRLIAPLAVMQQRIRAREPGLWQQKYVDRVAVLEDALDTAALEDFSLANDGRRRVTDVAGEILQRAGWGGPETAKIRYTAPRVLPDTPQTPIPLARETLVGAITAFLHSQPRRSLVLIRRALHRAIDDAGPDAMAQLSAQLATTGADWDYYPSNALARRIHRVLADQLLDGRSNVVGLENVARTAGKRVVVFANHLSYSDANLIEVLLSRGGASSLADRLTVVAGPKVYSSLQRRFSSLCFGTIKTPQSSARSSEDAVMNPREVARAARRSIEIANDRLRRGETLLVFAEGARSRTRGMQQMLAAVSRYLDEPDTWVLPMGITGTEELFPIGEDTIHPVPSVVRAGPLLSADELRETAGGNRQVMVDQIGGAIASLLPPEYRGTYAEAAG